jgi:hypothetical protein
MQLHPLVRVFVEGVGVGPILPTSCQRAVRSDAIGRERKFA